MPSSKSSDAKKVKDRPASAGTTSIGNASQAGDASATTPGGANTSAIDALKQDHRKVEQLFSQEEEGKRRLIREICSELIIHTKLEEEIFYRACRESGCGGDIINEAQVEHDSAKLLIADLLEAEADEPFTEAKVSVLSEQIKHHVAEEEKAGQGILAQAKAHGVDTPELARRLAARKRELRGRAADLRPTRAISFNLDLVRVMEEGMARYDRAWDDRGRFIDDDDDRRGRGGGRGWYGDPRGHSEAARERWGSGYRSRSRYDDDDDDRGGYRGNDRERDEYGRFMSDDDDRGYRSRSRYDDDDDDRGGYRGNDRERDDRGRFISDDDDRGYRSRSRYDEDDDDDRGGRARGQGGWFGDSEGHSEAARRGRSGGLRSRSDRDDDRRGRAGGHGGWFGDSRGHAQAARRGWSDRR